MAKDLLTDLLTEISSDSYPLCLRAEVLTKVEKRLESVPIEERGPGVLTSLLLEVKVEVDKKELEKVGRSEPCKYWSPSSRLCEKGKKWWVNDCCIKCDDYEPREKLDKAISPVAG